MMSEESAPSGVPSSSFLHRPTPSSSVAMDASLSSSARYTSLAVPSGASASAPPTAASEGPRSSAPSSAPTTIRATVLRRRCGTGYFDKNWLNLDACGLICAGITYGLHAYGAFAVIFVVLPPLLGVPRANPDAVPSRGIHGHRTEAFPFWRYDLTFAFGVVGFLYLLLAFLAVANHFCAMTTDPGSVPPDARPLPTPEEKDYEDLLRARSEAEARGVVLKEDPPPPPPKRPVRMCRRCNSFKPPRAHHCSICRRCVTKMDHHCPWVNNCVGIGNHKFFLLFIFYTFLACGASMTAVAASFFKCAHAGHGGCDQNPREVLYAVGLVVEGILFGLFTCCMMLDQWETVSSGMTQIDRLKGDTFDLTERPNVNEVFGGDERSGGRQNGGNTACCNVVNFLPVAVKFPASIRDEVMGFCVPCYDTRDMTDKNGEEVRSMMPEIV